MADPFANVLDLQARWIGKTLTEAEQAVATILLADASGIIRAAAPLIDARIAAGTLDADVVKAVAVAMVKREMANPENLVQFASSIDDYQRSGTYGTTMAAAELYLTDREAKRLGAKSSGRAFTISPSVPDTPGWHRRWR